MTSLNENQVDTIVDNLRQFEQNYITGITMSIDGKKNIAKAYREDAVENIANIKNLFSSSEQNDPNTLAYIINTVNARSLVLQGSRFFSTAIITAKAICMMNDIKSIKLNNSLTNISGICKALEEVTTDFDNIINNINLRSIVAFSDDFVSDINDMFHLKTVGDSAIESNHDL